MALLNRFFPTKKKSHKQGYVPFGKSDHNGWRPFNFTREQVRLLLFRECDARGRKLLYDSSAVVETVFDNQQCSKSKIGLKPKCDNLKKTESYVEITNGIGYQYTRPGSDVSLLGEMIFGSVAMTFKGMTCKIHCMKSPDRVMCSRVFHAPAAHCSSKRRSDQSIDSSGSSISSLNDSLFSLSGNYETKLKVNNTSGPLDVPHSDSNGKAPTSSLEGDSGFCGDASLHSISSNGSSFWMQNPYGCDSKNSSTSTLGYSSNSGGSLASLQRRWMKNVSTSLEQGVAYSPWHFIRRKNSSGLSDDISTRLHRKTQLGLTVVISVPPEQEKDMELFFFEHVAIIEGMIERLQNSVEKAYMKKEVFVHLMTDAFHDLQQWLCDLFTAPRLICPVWLGLVSPECHNQSSRVRCGIVTAFLRDFCQLIAALDTKATNFFISTLVTAVLTHHLGWVATIMPAKAPPCSVTKPPCAVQMLHALAKSHPYNALWAQLGDLHGALGNPVKIARTIVTANGKKSDLLNKLLTSLSYFIRSGNIEKRVNSEIVVGCEEDILNAAVESSSCASLNSSTASTSTIVPNDSKIFSGYDCKTGLTSASIILNNSRNGCSEGGGKDRLRNEEVNLNCSSRLPQSNTVSKLTKSSTLTNCLNLSSKEDNSSCEKSNLYPDLSNIGNELFHPDVISEKVSRLCRVPTNALLYHLNKDEPKIESMETVLPKKVDCEKQLSSAHTERRERYMMPIRDRMELKNLPKETESYTSGTNKSGVIFVLGDNEELVDLKNQSGHCIPKSKSDNILCSDTSNPKISGLKKSSCYPSLEGLLNSENKSQYLKVNVNYVHKVSSNEKENIKACDVKANAIRTSQESTMECFSDCSETGLDSGIVLEEENSVSKHVSSDQKRGSGRVNVWKHDRTNKSVCVENTSSATAYTEDINGNPRTASEGNSCNCKVVMSHSFFIELEDVHGCTDIKSPVEEKKASKHVARSQSLSFPDKKSFLCKKSVSICRRHSENMHVNDRYLRDYHSVRFNFERCDGVLSDYVDGIGIDKSPQTDKKSMKISEARGNFELQDKICDKGEKVVSLNSVLSNNDMCDCTCKINVSEECVGEEKVSVNLKSEEREGNALFDDYGTLSDDELLSSTEVSVEETSGVVFESKDHRAIVELPLPWYSSSHELSSGLAASLLGGVSDHYMPDMVLHGCTQALSHWEATLKNDLSVSAHRPMLDQEISEAVCIVGNVDLWEVQLVSSHVSVVDKPGGLGIRVGMSQLVANMLESLLHLWKLRASPEQCLQHLESKLRELCLRSQALAELLLTTELCDLATLTSSLGLEANDVPLLLAIASTHTPQVTNLYGLSFR